MKGIGWARRPRTRSDRGDASGDPAIDASEPSDATRQTVIRETIVLADLASGPAVALQVRRVLSLLGVSEVAPELGAVFDADLHHVVATVEDADRGPGEIIEVVRPGWIEDDRLLRPAEVTVSVRPGVSMPS